MSGPWNLGIDFGTTFTVAAVHSGDRTEVLEIDGQRRFPSAVFLEEDGSVLVGARAERRGSADPHRLERTPKRYLDVGQPPIALGGKLVDVTALVAAVLRVVLDEAIRQYGDDPPPQVVLTHPAGWGARRRELLQRAAADAGMPGARLMAEPQAAAMYLAAERAAGSPIGHGEHVAVYDLGGGTFDTALLRRTGSGFFVVGEPGGDPRIGGEVFDDRLYRQLGRAGLDADVWSRLLASDDPSWMRANWDFKQRVREAKEAVSRDATAPVYIPAPVERELQVTRAQVEDLVRDDIRATLDLLQSTIEQGGASGGRLSALFLVGGSSRMPVVAGMVRERFGRADTKGDPKQVVALGAARASAAPLGVANSDPRQTSPVSLPVGTRRRRRVPVLGSLGAVFSLAVLAAGSLLLPGGPHPRPVPPVPTPAADHLPRPSSTGSLNSGSTSASTKVAPSPVSQTSTVTGTITEVANGQPYPNATVTFYHFPDNSFLNAKTDQNGRYAIQLTPGTYRVDANDEVNLESLFAIAGGGNASVSVPPSTKVDFVECPVNQTFSCS